MTTFVVVEYQEVEPGGTVVDCARGFTVAEFDAEAIKQLQFDGCTLTVQVDKSGWSVVVHLKSVDPSETLRAAVVSEVFADIKGHYPRSA